MKFKTTLVCSATGKPLILLANAERFATRLIGLLRYRQALGNRGLLFKNCRSVHTWGMAFPIDLLWLDSQGCVVGISSRVSPWRFKSCAGADCVVELPAGFITSHSINLGHKMEFVPCV